MELDLDIKSAQDVSFGVRVLNGEEAPPTYSRAIEFTAGYLGIDLYWPSGYYASERYDYCEDRARQRDDGPSKAGDEAVFTSLAAAIETCKVPKLSIQFAFCNLSESAVIRLAEAVEKNTTLKGFSCFRNPGNRSVLAQAKLRAAVVVTKAPIESWNNYSPIPAGLIEMRLMLSLCLALIRRRPSAGQDKSLTFALPVDVLKLVRDAIYSKTLMLEEDGDDNSSAVTCEYPEDCYEESLKRRLAEARLRMQNEDSGSKS